jgi:two-component system phosphate regulon response regulator PhoB
VNSSRIVLIDDGPVKERLASFFERNVDETASGLNRGERVCEAHILAPNLILLDLSRACVDHATASRHQQRNDVVSEMPIFRLAGGEHQPGEGLAATSLDADQAISPSSNVDSPPSENALSTYSSPQPPGPVLQIGPVRIDRHTHWAYVAEKRLHLTPTEFRLLECFLREPGRAFTRSQLLDVSIGNASFVLERTIDVHIRSLRTKLGDGRDLIETVRGIGYRFRAESE